MVKPENEQHAHRMESPVSGDGMSAKERDVRTSNPGAPLLETHICHDQIKGELVELYKPFRRKQTASLQTERPGAAGDRYQWRVSPYEVFPKCAEQLYKVLLTRGSKAKIISHLGTDAEYWGACAQIIMRAQTTLLEEKFSKN